jgi:D-arabinose 1-dehydrogenase-like Zn-dependent alcohol dehydrogenase
VIGHEPLGEVEEVGEAVTLVKKGDRGDNYIQSFRPAT